MARIEFGGLFMFPTGAAVAGPSLDPGTVWTAATGGEQITDLLTLRGQPVDHLTTELCAPNGYVQFLGPDDGTSVVWVECSATDRVKLGVSGGSTAPGAAHPVPYYYATVDDAYEFTGGENMAPFIAMGVITLVDASEGGVVASVSGGGNLVVAEDGTYLIHFGAEKTGTVDPMQLRVGCSSYGPILTSEVKDFADGYMTAVFPLAAGDYIICQVTAPAGVDVVYSEVTVARIL